MTFQVQVKHWDCTPWPAASCVCGVAVREGDLILIADKCEGTSALKADIAYVTYDPNDELEKDRNIGIFTGDSSVTFKASA